MKVLHYDQQDWKALGSNGNSIVSAVFIASREICPYLPASCAMVFDAESRWVVLRMVFHSAHFATG
jgi:hypothetical protein